MDNRRLELLVACFMITSLGLASGDDTVDSSVLMYHNANVTVSMSSEDSDMDASRAMDGVLDDEPYTCGCCAKTMYNTTAWWQVDFGKLRLINQISVYGRHSENTFRELIGFQIYLSKTSQFEDAPVYVHAQKYILNNRVSVTLPKLPARYVRIQRAGNLTLCEIQISEADVPNHHDTGTTIAIVVGVLSAVLVVGLVLLAVFLYRRHVTRQLGTDIKM